MPKEPLGLRLAEHAKQFMQVPASGKVFQAGQPGDCMYAVKSGTLQVRIGKAVVETLGPGDVFGEMALLNDNEVRSATVVAMTDSVLAVIDAKRFEFMVKHVPSFAIELMRILAARLLEMNKRVRAPS